MLNKDFFDIIIVAFLLYEFLLLIRRTRSFLIINGLTLVAVLYFLSQFFKLQLTRLIFQSFFASLVIILVIIFQKEIRNFFEYLPFIGRNFYQKKKLSVAIRDGFFQVIEEIANQKIGALIVLSGRQEVDRYLEGGIKLDGNFSRVLLLSIFDPTSPGHDGAVVIEGDKIKKFGVHLPLSGKFIDNLGTRHRAGLGLSEHCDALVIIISEERGTISIAYQGNLKVVDRRELEAEINQFLNEKVFKSEKGAWYYFVTGNLKEKILALIIAILLWFILIH